MPREPRTAAKLAKARAEMTRLRADFERAAKKYARYVRKQLASGMWEPSVRPEETVFLKSFDALTSAEFLKSRKNKGSM